MPVRASLAFSALSSCLMSFWMVYVSPAPSATPASVFQSMGRFHCTGVSVTGASYIERHDFG